MIIEPAIDRRVRGPRADRFHLLEHARLVVVDDLGRFDLILVLEERLIGLNFGRLVHDALLAGRLDLIVVWCITTIRRAPRSSSTLWCRRVDSM